MPRKMKSPKDFFGNAKKGPEEELYALVQGVSASALHHLVVMAVRAGGAVMVGTTRDLSAVTLRIYLEGEGQTFYAGSVADLEDLVRHWAECYESVWEDAEKGASARK